MQEEVRTQVATSLGKNDQNTAFIKKPSLDSSLVVTGHTEGQLSQGHPWNARHCPVPGPRAQLRTALSCTPSLNSPSTRLAIIRHAIREDEQLDRQIFNIFPPSGKTKTPETLTFFSSHNTYRQRIQGAGGGHEYLKRPFESCRHRGECISFPQSQSPRRCTLKNGLPTIMVADMEGKVILPFQEAWH